MSHPGPSELSSVGSIGSDESVHPFDGQHATSPIQLDSESRGNKKSFARRLSSATASFFSIPTDAQEDLVVTEENNYLEVADQQHQEDLFGHYLISRQLTKKDSDEEEFPQTYDGGVGATRDSSAPTTRVTTRRRSTIVSAIQKVTSKFGFWDSSFHEERIKIYLTFAENYLWLIFGLLVVLCIYWGAYYERNTRYKDLKFAVVIADTQQGQLPAIVGPVVEYFFTNITAIHSLGNFEIWNYTRINTAAVSHNNTITQEVNRLVHHHKVWAAFYVNPNATLQWYQALQSNTTDFSPANSILELIYETGRDYNAITNYISSVCHSITSAFASYVPQSPLVTNLLKTISAEQQLNVLTNQPTLITTNPSFTIRDLIPVTSQVVQAPFQIGMIYLVLFTFFQFIFTIEIQMYIATKVKGLKFVAVKMLAAQFAYIVLSLSFVLLNLAFGMKFNVTFGYSGFLVIWAFSFLLMSSLGSFIEIFVLIVGAFKAPLMGFVLIFVAVLNVAVTIAPPVLCPAFYRYGYAIPVRNAYELLNVAYFNSWKGRVGLNIGVLMAWIVVTNAGMPFVMKWLFNKKTAQAKAAKEAAEKAAQEATEDSEKPVQVGEK